MLYLAKNNKRRQSNEPITAQSKHATGIERGKYHNLIDLVVLHFTGCENDMVVLISQTKLLAIVLSKRKSKGMFSR